MTNLDAMTDDQILEAAGDCGPAIIGQALFDRAQSIRVQNPTGALGPAIVGAPRPNDIEAAREAEALDDLMDARRVAEPPAKKKVAKKGKR